MLLDREKNRDKICTRVFEKYYRELAFFASRVLKDMEAAEDVVQDVFVMLFEKGIPVEDEEELSSYLYVIVRNRCLDYIKHLKIVEKHQQENLGTEVSQESILASIIETETLSILKREIELLPAECAKVMRLSLFGYNSTEIARQLGIEPSTVRAQKQRGISLLKNTLPSRIFLLVVFRLL